MTELALLPTGFGEVPSAIPTIVCVATDGIRAVGTASEDYRFLFHNRANVHLWCVHSQ